MKKIIAGKNCTARKREPISFMERVEPWRRYARHYKWNCYWRRDFQILSEEGARSGRSGNCLLRNTVKIFGEPKEG